MICTKCDRNLVFCICDDVEARLESLRGSKYLHIDLDAILAQRHLNKFDIEREREAKEKT